jgi:hypothetical protein
MAIYFEIVRHIIASKSLKITYFSQIAYRIECINFEAIPHQMVLFHLAFQDSYWMANYLKLYSQKMTHFYQNLSSP